MKFTSIVQKRPTSVRRTIEEAFAGVLFITSTVLCLSATFAMFAKTAPLLA